MNKTVQLIYDKVDDRTLHLKDKIKRFGEFER